MKERDFEQTEKGFTKRTISELGEQMEESTFENLIREAAQESLKIILQKARNASFEFKEKLLFLGMLTAVADGSVAESEKRMLAESLKLLGITKERYNQIAKKAILAIRAKRATERESE